MSEFARKLGYRLRYARRQRLMSLRQVEQASGHLVTAGALGMYERGDRSISAQTLWELAGFYGISPADLLPESHGKSRAEGAGSSPASVPGHPRAGDPAAATPSPGGGRAGTALTPAVPAPRRGDADGQG